MAFPNKGEARVEATSKLTAYNQDVQRYVEKGNAEAKREIIQELKEDALKKGINFNRLFPPKSKKLKVLDEIVFMLSSGGICKVSSETLAKNTDSSVRTVKESVKGIKQLGLFIVGGLADGKNKYIFVYKKHDDFMEILSNVFYLDAQQIAQQTAQQKNAEPVDNKGIEGENSSPNSNNNSIFKQEKDIIRESIENDVKQSVNQDERIEEYVSNPYQKMLYEYIKNNDLHERLKEDASVIALRAGSNCNEKMFNVARDVVNKLNFKLWLGTEIDSIPAVFEKMYHFNLNHGKKAPAPKEKRDTSYLYNWLEE